MDTLDFLYLTWGGIHRRVSLEATATTWIEDLFVLPHVSEGMAEIRLTTGGANVKEFQAVAEIVDQDGRVVGRGRAFIPAGGREGKSPNQPWQSAALDTFHPHLYTARVTLEGTADPLDSPLDSVRHEGVKG